MTDLLQGRGMAVAFGLLAVLAVLVIWRSLQRLQSGTTTFDLRDLLTENGRVSKSACVMMGAFAVTTWQFVYFSLNGKMTEGYFGLYAAAWIAPVVARLIAKGEGTSPTSQVVTETKTTVSAP